MIEDLKPYPARTPVDSPWTTTLPSGWELRRTKTLLRERSEKGFPALPLLAATQSKGVIAKSDYETRTVTATKDLHLLKLVEPGDFAISLRSFQGGLEIAHARGIISPAYTILEPRTPQLRGYLRYFFKSSAFVNAMTLFVTGIREGQNIDYSRLARTELPQPPPDEQAAIVRFLDHANRRIDQFIRVKKKLIALLNEQKQAIIHRAVTRGLDPRSTTRETESRWFPSVPSQWDVLPLARVISAAIDGPHFSPSYLDKGVPFLSARNIKADRWSLDDAKFISEADYEEFSRRVKPEMGDVLYTKGGTTGVARAVDLTFKFQVWVHVAVLKLVPSRVEPHFLAYALNSPRCYEQAQLFTRGATNQDLGLGRMKRIEIPLPPTGEEQRSIVRHLDGETHRFTTALRSAGREIEFAREYRTRLISDVVTGQLDVRAAAASLPDLEPDTAPAEPSDDELELDDPESVA